MRKYGCPGAQARVGIPEARIPEAFGFLLKARQFLALVYINYQRTIGDFCVLLTLHKICHVYTKSTLHMSRFP
jgi:hypothetical protein